MTALALSDDQKRLLDVELNEPTLAFYSALSYQRQQAIRLRLLEYVNTTHKQVTNAIVVKAGTLARHQWRRFLREGEPS